MLLGILWYLLEAVYALALGFPWLDMAGALSPWPVLVQAADLVGGYALTGLWTMAALLCCLAFVDSARRFCPDRTSLAPGLLLAAALLCYGGWRLYATPFAVNPTGPQSVDVLFVEGNVDQNQKWIPAFQRQTVDLYLGLTYQGLAEKPDVHPLIIWPETAMSLNIACALHQMGFKTLLMDCDLGLANLDVLLGITPEGNLQTALLGEADITDVLCPIDGDGFAVLPAASGVPELTELQPDARDLLLSRLEPVLHKYDYVFMDIGAGISGTVQTFAAMIVLPKQLRLDLKLPVRLYTSCARCVLRQPFFSQSGQ